MYSGSFIRCALQIFRIHQPFTYRCSIRMCQWEGKLTTLRTWEFQQERKKQVLGNMTFLRSWNRLKMDRSSENWGQHGVLGDHPQERKREKTAKFSRIFLFVQKMGGEAFFIPLSSNVRRFPNQAFVHLPGNSTITVFLEEKCVPASKEPIPKCIFEMHLFGSEITGQPV